MEEEVKDIYIGSKKVKDFNIADGIIDSKTIDLVGVLYEDDSCEDFTNEQWESVKSETKYDDGLVQTRKFEPLVRNILTLMLKNNLMVMEVESVLDLVDTSIRENYKTMINKMFYVKDNSFIKLAQIDQQLKILNAENAKQKE